MLALRLKQLEYQQSMPFIRDDTGSTIFEQTEIDKIFREYYIKLHQVSNSTSGLVVD